MLEAGFDHENSFCYSRKGSPAKAAAEVAAGDTGGIAAVDAAAAVASRRPFAVDSKPIF